MRGQVRVEVGLLLARVQPGEDVALGNAVAHVDAALGHAAADDDEVTGNERGGGLLVIARLDLAHADRQVHRPVLAEIGAGLAGFGVQRDQAGIDGRQEQASPAQGGIGFLRGRLAAGGRRGRGALTMRRLGLIGAPKAAETVMLERDMRLVGLTEGRYHAASVTCKDSLEVLKRAKDAGLAVTASASINHLALNENDIGGYRTFFKVSPPLRDEEDRRALVDALEQGLIDVVMSDHNPQDVEVKRLPFAEAAPGAVGIETMLPAVLRLVHSGDLKLMTALKALSSRPAELLGLPGGTLRPGAPADVVVIDPDDPWILDRDDLKSKCRNTPFDEARMQGRAVRTIVGGGTVYEYV